VIGAGSVVVKDISAGVVVAESPANESRLMAKPSVSNSFSFEVMLSGSARLAGERKP